MKRFKSNMRVTCDSFWFCLKKRKIRENKYPDKLLRASEHTQKIKFELYSYFYKILKIAKICKTETSVKIIKRKKGKFLIS